MRNLTKSTPCTKETDGRGFLNAEDICKILRASRESGVYTLKCGPLEVHFGPAPITIADDAYFHGAAPTPAAEDLGKITQAQKQAEEASLEEEGIRATEERLANLIVEDPLAFEEMLASGELEPKGDTTDGSGNEVHDL